MPIALSSSAAVATKRYFVLPVTFAKTSPSYLAIIGLVREREGAMTAIKTQRITNCLNRAASRNELTSLSDRALKDIGLVRRRRSVETCKPFWMARIVEMRVEGCLNGMEHGAMSIARNSFLSLSLAILLGSPTSVSAAAVTVCFPPFHKECDRSGDCHCVLMATGTARGSAAQSSGTTNPAGGTGSKHSPGGGAPAKSTSTKK